MQFIAECHNEGPAPAATGAGNLVVLRFGAYTADRPQKGEAVRIMPDGTPSLGGSEEYKSLPPTEMPGKFFAESAG